jgi:cytochrome c peroxidase
VNVSARRKAWRGALLALAVAGAMTGAAWASAPGAAAAPVWSAEQRALLETLGPWPPAPAQGGAARDPGNPVAHLPAAQQLGQRLFFDTRLSPDQRFSCASCHRPGQQFADGKSQAQGRERLARHTPSLWNAVHQRWQGWDGGADSLWSQALRALLAPPEMAGSAAGVQALVRGDAELRCRWQQVFGRASLEAADNPHSATTTLVQAGFALGAFVATLHSSRTPFDHFRDALLAGKKAAAARHLPAPAQRVVHRPWPMSAVPWRAHLQLR